MKTIPEKPDCCSFEGCTEPAEMLACGRIEAGIEKRTYHPEPAWYCATHAYHVADEGYPEYNSTCPCCGCLHGVN